MGLVMKAAWKLYQLPKYWGSSARSRHTAKLVTNILKCKMQVLTFQAFHWLGHRSAKTHLSCYESVYQLHSPPQAIFPACFLSQKLSDWLLLPCGFLHQWFFSCGWNKFRRRLGGCLLWEGTAIQYCSGVPLKEARAAVYSVKAFETWALGLWFYSLFYEFLC